MEDDENSELLRGGSKVVAEEREEGFRLGQWVDEPAPQYLGHRMEPVFKRGDNAKIAPAAPHAPEELLVLTAIDCQERAVRRDDIHGQEVIAAQAILAAEPALATPERQPRDARGGDHAPWRRQAKGRSLPVEIAPRDTALGMDRLAQGVDAQAFHRTEVDD